MPSPFELCAGRAAAVAYLFRASARGVAVTEWHFIMKTFLSILMLAALSSIASAAPKEGWIDDLEKAKAQAKAENKKILLDFTGSDWCGWCKKLDAEVFSQPAFKDYAAKHLVLVEVDFPRSFQLPEATKKQNDELAKKFKIQRLPHDRHHQREWHEEGRTRLCRGGPEAFLKQLRRSTKRATGIAPTTGAAEWFRSPYSFG
jgi:protein disulfide-isomerase